MDSTDLQFSQALWSCTYFWLARETLIISLLRGAQRRSSKRGVRVSWCGKQDQGFLNGCVLCLMALQGCMPPPANPPLNSQLAWVFIHWGIFLHVGKMCTNSAERFPPWLSRRPWAPSSAVHQPPSESVHLFLQHLEWLVNNGQLLLQVKVNFLLLWTILTGTMGKSDHLCVVSVWA